MFPFCWRRSKDEKPIYVLCYVVNRIGRRTALLDSFVGEIQHLADVAWWKGFCR